MGGEPSFAGASPLTQLCQHRTFTGSVFPAARLSAMPAAATGRPSSVPRSFADELRNRGEIIESEGGLTLCEKLAVATDFTCKKRRLP
jgi:hypothetical protein